MIGEGGRIFLPLFFFKLAPMLAQPVTVEQKFRAPVRPHDTEGVDNYLVPAWDSLDRVYFVWVEGASYQDNGILSGTITYKDMGRAINGSKQSLQIYPTKNRTSVEAKIAETVLEYGSEFLPQQLAIDVINQLIGTAETLGEEIRKEIVFINEALSQPFNITD